MIRTAVPCVAEAASDLAARGRRLDLGALICALLAYLVVKDPHRQVRWFPRCPTKLLTGLDCPACGGLRLGYDLLHGDFRAAINDNPFLLVCSPGLALLAWWGWSRSGEQDSVVVPRWAAYSLAGVAGLWMAVRNLPSWPLKPTTA